MYSEEIVTGIKNIYLSTKAGVWQWLDSETGRSEVGLGVFGISMTKLRDF